MNTINLEGKIYGYNKKTLAIIAMLILVAGIMFYAGAKYEKKKLTALGVAKCKTSQSTGTKKAKKQATPATDGTATPTANGATTAPVETTTNTPADGAATPTTTTKPATT